MEVFFDPEKWGVLDTEEKLQLALAAFDEENDEQRRKFIKQNFAQDHLDDYEERKQLGAGMLTHYAREIHPHADNWFKPIRTEVSFHVPLRDENDEPIVCMNSPACGQEHPNPAPCTLDGRLDVLVEDIVNGGYYIVDWKTAATLLSNDRYLYLDDQIGTYLAALREELNINVKGFLYIEIAKGYPMAPNLNKRKTKGCWYSVSKSQPTTYDIAKPIFELYDKEAYDEGLYDGYLTFLQSGGAPKFSQRFAIRQSETKSKNILLNTGMEASDMVDKNLPIYPSPNKFMCGSCPFYEPCLEKLNGEDYQTTLENNYVGA